MGLTPAELDDALAAGLARTRWRLRRRRIAIWLTRPNVIIDGIRWNATVYDHRGFGYTRAQAREMRRALVPVLEAFEPELEALILAVLDRDTAQ